VHGLGWTGIVISGWPLVALMAAIDVLACPWSSSMRAAGTGICLM
jgi:hypothetical protein